jgi:hypothetical protein
MGLYENLSIEEIESFLDEDELLDDAGYGDSSAPIRKPSVFPIFYMVKGDQMNDCNASDSFPMQQQCSNFCKSRQGGRCMHLRFGKYCTY